MGNNTGQNPNFLELESLRSELIEKSFRVFSHNLKVFLYYDYFQKVLLYNNKNLAEAFLTEFIDNYTNVITRFEVWGINPEFTLKIISQLSDLKTLSTTTDYLQTINTEIERIEKQLQKLNSILQGSSYPDNSEQKAFFPLVDREAPENFYGTIDSFTVRINKCVEKDKFIIIPSEKELEKKILEQCQNSWLLALNLLKVYVKKPCEYHEVIISFDKKEGIYEGNSLGIALTLSFLEQLLGFYNPSYIIKIKEQSAFTGGVTETGMVLTTGEDIIKQKVAAIFFSEMNTFVIPKIEETYAYFSLTQLKNQYPERNLKLIPAEDIYDVLNRRDLVEIKKRNPVVRTGKFVKKNWASAAITFLLTILFAYLFVMDWDDNPAALSADGHTLYVKNKKGKVLWTIDIASDNTYPIFRYARILDINNDGINEIILSADATERNKYLENLSKIICYDKYRNIVWTHIFNDKVHSLREELNSDYGTKILDTLTVMGQKSLFLVATNIPLFSSAIYRIDLKTGERLPGTFWCSGHIVNGMIKDINFDGKEDILCVGVDNGYEDAIFFGFNIDTLTRVRLTTDEYLIRNYPVADLIAYIRFSKTDYDNYMKFRMPPPDHRYFEYLPSQKIYQFITVDYLNNRSSTLWYQVSDNLKDISIVVDCQFRVLRDSLVACGELQPPLTDTEEYKNIIKSKILYWKDGKWVKRDELD